MAESFRRFSNGCLYHHQWNVDLYEFRNFDDAKQFQLSLVKELKSDTGEMSEVEKIKSCEKNYALTYLHGWKECSYCGKELISLYEHCKIESGFTSYYKIVAYMNWHYGHE